MALTTARISSARWRPPGLGGGIKSLIRFHAASVRSVGYGVVVIPPVYRTGATYGRLFKQPLRVFSCTVRVCQSAACRRTCKSYLGDVLAMEDLESEELLPKS